MRTRETVVDLVEEGLVSSTRPRHMFAFSSDFFPAPTVLFVEIQEMKGFQCASQK